MKSSHLKLYKSKIGETRTYEGWKLEADKFYKGLTTDYTYPTPKDWFKRMTKVLELTLIVNEGSVQKQNIPPLTCRKCEMLDELKYLQDIKF
jgi:hypothetical protein